MRCPPPGAAYRLLGQEKLGSPRRLEPAKARCAAFGSRLTNAPPADEAARPVAPPCRCLAHEGLIGDRLGALPFAPARDSRESPIGAAARAGQDEEAFMPVNEVLQAGLSGHPLISLNP